MTIITVNGQNHAVVDAEDVVGAVVAKALTQGFVLERTGARTIEGTHADGRELTLAY